MSAVMEGEIKRWTAREVDIKRWMARRKAAVKAAPGTPATFRIDTA